MTDKINIWHRHKARVHALQALYQWEISGNEPARIEASTQDSFVKVDEDYFSLLFQGVISHTAILDRDIALASDRDLDRLDSIVRNILRLAVYELAYCWAVSTKIIISEAIKLSQQFASPQAHTYVNGVLDRLQHKLRGEWGLIKLLNQEINRDALLRHGDLTGDDCALLPPTEGLLISVDSLVADTHFPAAAPPFLIGYRSLCASVSDLAAMAAIPDYFLCALSIPSHLWQREYLYQLAAGIRLAARHCNIELAGGNITTAPCFSVNMTVLGHAQHPLTRRGSQPGDRIFVSGTLGDSSGGLQFANKPASELSLPQASLRAAYFCSLPRLALGQALVGVAHACIDISDGLSGDIYQLLLPLGANIDSTKLPLSSSLVACFSYQQSLQLALGPSDDYELLFTTAAADEQAVVELADRLGITVTCIGEVTEGDICMDGKPLEAQGYQHQGNSV